ncbi:MAG TPA: hypothetical protein VGK06_15485 [Methanosarcina sp.]|jgi:hypothetical protein
MSNQVGERENSNSKTTIFTLFPKYLRLCVAVLSLLGGMKMDIRSEKAYQIYEKNSFGKLIVNKTARAGGTTSLIIESIKRNEQITVCVPTHKIAQETIIKDIVELGYNTEMVEILSNNECIKNKELIEEFPNLSFLPYLPLFCKKCGYFDTCPVNEINRKPDVKVIIATYDKLVGLLEGNSNKNREILEKILNSRNFLFDEIHHLETKKITEVPVYVNSIKEDEHFINYLNVETKYLARVLGEFYKIIDIFNDKIIKIYNDTASKEHFKSDLFETEFNPSIGIVDNENPEKVFAAVYKEIIDLMKVTNEPRKVLQLYNIFKIILSKLIVIEGSRYGPGNSFSKVSIVAKDQGYDKIKKFIFNLVSNARVFVTSATIEDEIFDNPTYVDFGDPLNTCSKMAVYTDGRKYDKSGRYSFFKKRKEITANIIQILKEGEAKIFAPSKQIANIFKRELKEAGYPHDIDYYRSENSTGVKCDLRKAILIGAAFIPQKTYAAVTPTKEDAKKKALANMQESTYQTLSRVKDPNGIEESEVFCIGITREVMEGVLTWGSKREIREEGVKCINPLPKPKIIDCKNAEEMLKISKMKVELDGTFYYQNEVFPYIDNNREKCCFDNKNSLSLLVSLLNRRDIYAVQKRDGYKAIKSPLTDSLLLQHLEGKITLGAYQLDKENMVKWIVFDPDAHIEKGDSQEEIEKKFKKAEDYRYELEKYFISNNIPYMLEASGSPHSYHLWVFVKPVSAKIAKAWGEDIKRKLKLVNCEVFPKQTSISTNGYGNLVKLPFAINRKNGNKSKIWKNGAFVDNFDSLEIGVIDISNYVPEQKEVKEKTVLPVKGTIRTCIKEVLEKQLTGGGGHMMRIAVVCEYFNAGMTDEEELTNLFRKQKDFKYEITIGQVRSIINKNYKRVSCKKLQEVSSQFLNCDSCNKEVIRCDSQIARAGAIDEKIRTGVAFMQIIQGQSPSYTDFSASVTTNEQSHNNIKGTVQNPLNSGSALRINEKFPLEKYDFSLSADLRIAVPVEIEVSTSDWINSTVLFLNCLNKYTERINGESVLINSPITSVEIAEHLKGEKEYGMYLKDENNKTKCIVFKSEDMAPGEICKALDKEKVPWFFENQEYYSRTWVLIKPTDAKIAYTVGEQIKEKYKLDCMVLNYEGDFRLIGGKYSQIWMKSHEEQVDLGVCV